MTLLLAAPAPALADGGPLFTLGPIKVKHGYTLTVLGLSCGTKFAGGNVNFTKTGRGWIENHAYGGANNAKCQIARNLASGSLKFSLGRSVTVNINFRKRGSAKRGTLPPGCTGTPPKVQGGTATGTVKVSISKSFFGKVSLGKVRASLSGKPSYTCNGTAFQKTIFMGAFQGTESNALVLSAGLPPKGPRTVSIFKSIAGRKRFESHGLFLTGGSSLFSARSNLSSAKVNGAGKVTGHLKFTATPGCKGNNRTGTLSGSLVAHFDVIGNQTLKQTKHTSASLSKDASGQPCT